MYDDKYKQDFTEEELNNEIWKDVVGYEGLYKVSNLDRVRSLDRVVTRKDGRKQLCKGRLLSPCRLRWGYLGVDLSKSNKGHTKKVHRLVAQAFLNNSLNLSDVNHIDEDKTNNRLSNLEWCSREYNMNYGTIKEKISKSVIMYDIQGNKLKEFKSTRSAGRYLNDENKCSAISNCCNGKRKTAYGYIWKYK